MNVTLSRKKTAEAQAQAQPAPAPAKQRKRGDVRRRGAAANASVNLLSPWVLDELRVRRLRLRFIAGAVALVVVTGLGWVGLQLQLDRARTDLAGDRAVNDALTVQIDDMAEVRTYVSGVQRRELDVEETMAGELALSEALSALDGALPDGAAYASLDVVLPEGETAGEVPTVSPCPGPDPFGATVVVACVNLTGTAQSRDDVSKLVIALGNREVFVEPFITTTTTDQAEATGTVAFAGSVGLSPAVLSGRFLPEDETGTEKTETDEESAR